MENYKCMNKIELKNRTKKYSLIENAGKYYVDETSEIVKKLNSEGKNVLVGIQNKKKGVYTILGERFVYYLTSSGKTGQVLNGKFSDELHENGCRIGKGYLKFKLLYKNIVLSNKDKVWLYNAKTMFSLWSTIIWLEEEERKRVFREKNK